MILGVGIDLVDVDRIATRAGRETGFKELLFSEKEIAYCETKAHKFEHYAARFAAKEAFFKAVGTGWAEGTNYNEVEITNDETGKPTLTLVGATQKKLECLGVTKISVSLSHLASIASAVVIIEK